MATYPEAVSERLAQARTMGAGYYRQPAAAALCFEVLAEVPTCREASDLVYDLFCNETLIEDLRQALREYVDEWDDRPHQQRRRKGLSFRRLSLWDGWSRELLPDHSVERDGPPDVCATLAEGKQWLMNANYLGDDVCIGRARLLFQTALATTSDPCAARLWIAKQYADLGFFADAADVLGDLCARQPDPDACHLLAEVRWWRDHAHRLPWLVRGAPACVPGL